MNAYDMRGIKFFFLDYVKQTSGIVSVPIKVAFSLSTSAVNFFFFGLEVKVTAVV